MNESDFKRLMAQRGIKRLMAQLEVSESDFRRLLAQRERERRARETAYAALVVKYDLRSDGDPSQPFSDFLCDIPLGWLHLIEGMVCALIALGWDRQVGQMKERLGALRVYVGHHCTDAMQRLIDETERRSLTICDKCGNPGTLRPGPGIETLCNEHAEGRPAADDAFFERAGHTRR
jgi:hypothetical protein